MNSWLSSRILNDQLMHKLIVIYLISSILYKLLYRTLLVIRMFLQTYVINNFNYFLLITKLIFTTPYLNYLDSNIATNKVDNLTTTINQASNSTNKNSYLNFTDSFPSINNIIDYIYNYFNTIYEYGLTVPFEDGLILSHMIAMMLLLSLLIYSLAIINGNYLINRLNLTVKYPKLTKLLEYRMKYQKFNLFYNITLAIIILLHFIIFDIILYFNL